MFRGTLPRQTYPYSNKAPSYIWNQLHPVFLFGHTFWVHV